LGAFELPAELPWVSGILADQRRGETAYMEHLRPI